MCIGSWFQRCFSCGGEGGVRVAVAVHEKEAEGVGGARGVLNHCSTSATRIHSLSLDTLPNSAPRGGPSLQTRAHLGISDYGNNVCL